jgi:hypothetical protein
MMKKDIVITDLLGDRKPSERLIYEYDLLNAVVMHYSCRPYLIDKEEFAKLNKVLQNLRESINTLIDIGV